MGTFVMGDLFVFDTFGDGWSTRTFNVVLLKDDLDLRVCGTVATKADQNVGAYAHYERFLIVLFWNRVEVYDLRIPEKPALARTFSLDEHEPWPGPGRIVANGDRSFLLFSTRTTAELRVHEDITRWSVRNLKRTKEMQAETLAKSNAPS